MRSITDRADEINMLVTGFAVPIFQRVDPYTGQTLNGLGPRDYDRIRAGYGCPECLALFKTYLVTCPACRHQRDIAGDIEETPGFWEQHLKDRADPEYGVRPQRFNIDEVLRQIHEDPDIDHVPLEKLKPSRWGAK